MQKGIATIEVILGALIISLLLSVAIPNATRILDRVALDYETKKFYSDLRFLQAMSRSNRPILNGTGRTDFVFDETLYMQTYPASKSYQILRGNSSNPVREIHYMQNIKTFNTPANTISFDSTGKASITSGAIVLTSRLGKTSKIVFDSVGRLRGGRDD
ncbi:MAG: hypothetical protein IJS69_06000 [Selenomonadaceae bacterium]|nr:hypothetical protein [Selenomonadaceae bacterium]